MLHKLIHCRPALGRHVSIFRLTVDCTFFSYNEMFPAVRLARYQDKLKGIEEMNSAPYMATTMKNGSGVRFSSIGL